MKQALYLKEIPLECSEIILENNSIILFNSLTNYNYYHKIILNIYSSDNRWLGITFRLSKIVIPHIFIKKIIEF